MDKILIQKGTKEVLEKFGLKNSKICLDFVYYVLDDLDNWSVCDNLAMFGVEPKVYSNPELFYLFQEDG
ncbi:unnamed protein product [marine sediment metagenome]|uniref:Uncharacterized protein n=1 Tax=marine sediment metagenome TaxID=412755 RepID=X1B3J6_9ZZZZ